MLYLDVTPFESFTELRSPRRTQETPRALADFDAALRLSPNDSGLYGFRAAARRETGDDAGAKADEAKMTELMFRNSQ